LVFDVCRQRRGQELFDELPDPEKVKTEDVKVWYYLGFLLHKINRFNDAIICFNQCLKFKENFVPALIKKGYSLEGAEPNRLEEAIECFKYLLELDTEEVRAEIGEIYHGLGHFYTELNKPIEGLSWMRKAMVEDIGYITCYGTCHSEQNKYAQARDIFSNALTLDGLRKILGDDLNDLELRQRHSAINNNKELLNELLFYNGEAYCGIGHYAKAIEYFRNFAKHCEQSQNYDGLAHAHLYIVKANLKKYDLMLLGAEQLKDYLNVLKKHRFSLFANRYIHKDHEKTIMVVERLLSLKGLLQKKSVTVDEVLQVAEYLINMLPTNTIYYQYVTDIEGDSPLENKFFEQLEMKENLDELLIPSFTFIRIQKQVTEKIFSAILQHDSKNPLFILNENVDIDLSVILGSKINEIQEFQKYEELECTALLISAYEIIKNDLLETVFLFGLTPTTEAPSFSAQTGVLDYLPYNDKEKSNGVN
jgi:tetratricopeptide (TPR) repeat protein